MTENGMPGKKQSELIRQDREAFESEEKSNLQQRQEWL